ncbi:MAG: EthD family reductase [Anaerolineae bacterium]|nr:EthD family reductase [Anaerolineae bacterium]
MIKMTVMYNLPEGADHEEFLKWRTGEHQADNAAIPGLIKTDFYVIKRAWNQVQAPYRYMTEAYYPDMETFEKTFFDPDYQLKMKDWLKIMADPVFLISEEVISQGIK